MGTQAAQTIKRCHYCGFKTRGRVRLHPRRKIREWLCVLCNSVTRPERPVVKAK